jgi:uncharacterized protein
MDKMKEPFSEKIVLLGSSKSRVGILVCPNTDRAIRRAVVILNTGIVHRVGHNRMWVTLSRRLAEAGHVVFRFDFSGIGDSDRADGGNLIDSALGEIREALEWLTQSGHADEFVLLGLCAGAYHAVYYGHSDPRVKGLVLIEPPLPPTTRYFINYVVPRLVRPSSWRTFLTGRGHALSVLADLIAKRLWRRQTTASQDLSPLDARDKLEDLYQKTVAEGIQILYVSGWEGVSARPNYAEQILDALPNVQFGDQLRIEFFKDCDHTFGSPADRKRLYDLVLEWTSATHFGRRARCSHLGTTLLLGVQAFF